MTYTMNNCTWDYLGCEVSVHTYDMEHDDEYLNMTCDTFYDYVYFKEDNATDCYECMSYDDSYYYWGLDHVAYHSCYNACNSTNTTCMYEWAWENVFYFEECEFF